ncbi:MAG: hypothetical protein QW348_04930 [Ignisphaera sp.]
MVTIGIGYLVRNSTVACIGVAATIAGLAIIAFAKPIATVVGTTVGIFFVGNLFGSNCPSLPPAGER